ncbi:MAG TPA: methylated-DNA--[protein]-cysteine S-methyltransferase [Burkholderiales bacterium]|nr:methylated-DNA--[protein]-cysteine S-methyltransferase [Burkholderiales bacterium]
MKPPPLLDSYSARIAAPFAVLAIRTSGERLTGIEYLPRGAATLEPVDRFAERVCRQIERYLDDPGFRFDLPFDYRGTEFQCRVWRAVHDIPSGRTQTYVDIARRLRTAPRPVGGACGANHLPLVIPCHRVVASSGIGGFMHSRRGPGIEIKRWLLRHEGVNA